jgi:hypothetical protein
VPPSHGGGQGFESPRVHCLFVAISRLNAMIERRCQYALGLWCSNAARAEARTRFLHWPPSRAARRSSGAIFAHLRWRYMEDSANGLLRIPLPETVWKIRIGSITRSHESAENGQKDTILGAWRYQESHDPTRTATFQTVSPRTLVNRASMPKASPYGKMFL